MTTSSVPTVADRTAGAQREFGPIPVPSTWIDQIPGRPLRLLLVALALLSLLLWIPSPYAVRMPGPTANTVGEVDGTPLIAIDAETFPVTGELLLTTVSVSGGPGFPTSVGQVIEGWWDSSTTVLPRETVFSPDVSREELDEQSQGQMVSSQELATVAALTELGYELDTRLVVAGAVEGMGAHGVVEPGDVIVSVTAPGGAPQATTDFAVLTDVLDGVPGASTVVLGVERDGEELPLEIVTTDDGDGGSLIGVTIDPDFTLPFEIEIEVENIGGSSAGTMFALGIMDLLTRGDATGGETIAGTGTIDLAGEVGAIGGIVQKMAGARRDGADYFLAPVANCGEVTGNVPAGVQVIAVATLAEAWTAVEAIGAGAAQDLPDCG